MAEVGNTNQIEMNNLQQLSVKTCKKCGEVLSLNEFYKRKNSSDGYSSYCKKCHNAMCLQYRKNRIQKLKQKISSGFIGRIIFPRVDIGIEEKRL